MAASSFGTKNEPQYADADAPDLALNPTQVAAYAAKVGNRRIGTTTERLAATGADVWESLIWGDTTEKADYKRIGTAWERMADSPPNLQIQAETARTYATNESAVLRDVWPAALASGAGNRAIGFSGNSSTTGGKFTPLVPGVYRFFFDYRQSAAARQIFVLKNGTGLASAEGTMPIMLDIAMNGSTDFFEVSIFTNGTATLTTGFPTRISITRIGPL